MAEEGERIWSSKPPARKQEHPLSVSALTGQSRTGWTIGILVSIAAHVAMFGGALLYARITPPRIVPSQPIMARLVRLGKPRPENMLPRLPGATREPEARHAPDQPRPPSESSKALPVPAAKPKPAEDEGESHDRASEALRRQKRLEDALSKLGAPTEGPTSKNGEAPPGQLDGDVDGNAEKAAAGDMYAAKVEAALRRNFVVPTAISDRERLYLNCRLRIFIAKDGTISHHTLETPSGNELFDQAVEAALERTGTLPPPPDILADGYASSGLGVRFKP